MALHKNAVSDDSTNALNARRCISWAEADESGIGEDRKLAGFGNTAHERRSGIIRILVTDDFAPWRRLVSSLLEKNPGWHVVAEAVDGLEAVQKAQELTPDLILLDIGLPKLSGIEAARRIRKVAPNSRILFVSTHADLTLGEVALDTGASGYVFKLNAGRELLPAVEAVLAGKRFVSRGLKGLIPADSEDAQTSARSGGREILASEATPPGDKEVSRRHEVLFYSNDACFFDSCAHLIETTLKAGNAAIVVATEPHRDGLLSRLRAQGLDISAAIGQRSYIELDAADTIARFTVNDVVDSDRFLELLGNLITSAANAAHGVPPRVAVYAECVALLCARGKAEEAIRIEQLGNELAKRYDLDILCGYSSRSFDSEEYRHIFQRICAEHSAVYSR